MVDVPLFSVVVPVHNVAGLLGSCLDSILGQSFGAFEVIAVDDASTDGSGALLDDRAAADARLRVEHLPHNAGGGAARNAGIDLATGRYVVFVDSDDELPPGALAGLAERIEAAGRPDVVIFGFVRCYEDGREVPDERSVRFLAPEAVVRLADRPELLEIFPSPCNKVYRRDFLDDHGLRFPPGTYEDLPFSYEVLVSAESIATLDRVGYRYRQRGAGSILSSAGRRHLDLLPQWDRTFAWLDAHPEYERWRRPLVERMTRHLPTVLERADRLPPDVRREFFDATSAAIRRHRPKDFLPSGVAGVKVRLIEAGNYPLYRAARTAVTRSRRLREPNPVAALFAPLLADARLYAAAPEPHDADALLAALRRDAAAVAPAAIAEYAAPDELKLALLRAIPGGAGRGPVRRREDAGRGLSRVSYLYAGDPPPETIVPPPVAAKTRDVEILGRVLLHERVAWVVPGARVEVGGDEVAMTRPRGRRSVRGAARRDLPATLARDARVRRLARSPRVRQRFADAWLLMDRDTAAQDNAEHFDRYLQQHAPEVNAWFVLAADSPDWPRLQRDGFRLIRYGTDEHLAALLHCRHLLSSQIDSYVVNPLRGHLLPRPRWRFTFLQHGVIKHDLSRWLNAKSIDLFVTSVPREHAAIAGDGPYAFTDLEVVLTGLPRHDRLLALSRRTTPDALVVMPTWRRELLGAQRAGNRRERLPGFWESPYARAWRGFLESPVLRELCERAGWRLLFVPHPNMQDYLADSPLPPHVEARRFDEVDVQQVLARAAALVTDYSSLAIEAGYLERPVVYYQFDRDTFFSGEHLYRLGDWDYQRQGFGPVTTDLDGLLGALRAVARDGAAPEYARRMREEFPFRDGRCSERVLAAVRERLGLGST